MSASQFPRRPLSIVIANDFAHVNGGAANVALSSAMALADRGHSVTLLAAVGPVDENLARSQVQLVLTEQRDIKSDPNRLRAASQGIWNPKAARAMAHVLAIQDRTNTIVHVHGWCKGLSSSIIRTARRMGFPVVVTLHDYFYACPNGGFFNFQKRITCQLSPLSGACIAEHCDRDSYAHKLWRCARQGMQQAVGFGDGKVCNFITISELSEAKLRPFLPSNAILHRIPNPIDVQRGDPVNVASNNTFVALGRLSPEKGFDVLARATEDSNLPMTFIGDGAMRAELQSLLPNACITGWLSRSEVNRYLTSARALVFPSLWYEAQPLAVLEAAALGIPTIVSDVCAGREAVVDGVTGLWFRSGDPADLLAKMKVLLDPSVAARMGQEAYDKYWRTPHTVQMHVERLVSCYYSILDARGALDTKLAVMQQHASQVA
jgi:glycosyltransferase involved in cell wall biosynthesis